MNIVNEEGTWWDWGRTGTKYCLFVKGGEKWCDISTCGFIRKIECHVVYFNILSSSTFS